MRLKLFRKHGFTCGLRVSPKTCMAILLAIIFEDLQRKSYTHAFLIEIRFKTKFGEGNHDNVYNVQAIIQDGNM